MRITAIKNAVVGTAITASLLMGSFAYAQGVAPGQGLKQATSNLDSAGGGAGLKNTPLPVMVGNIINIVLSLLGLIFLVLGVYAGFKWMTARGEESEIEEAKDTLKNAIIGLVIVLASYAISSYVVSSVINAAQ